MAISKVLTLALFILSTLALSVKSQDIHEILPAFNLPRGLFPDTQSQANIDSNGNMVVNLHSECYVRLPVSGTRLHYANPVKGVISFGRIDDIKGIEMQRELTNWVQVKRIKNLPEQGKVEFDIGLFSELLPLDDFKQAPQCKSSEVNLKFRNIQV